MKTTRIRGLVLGVLLASCAALPATASAQALSTSTTCLDPQGGVQNVAITASGLAPNAFYYPQIELTQGDDEIAIGAGQSPLGTDATGAGSSSAEFNPAAYAENAASGDGAGVWMKLRDGSWAVAAELRIPLCGAAQPDATAPVLTLPADLTADATSASGAPVSFTATATDDVDGAVAATCDPVSGSTFAVGTTTVTCSAKDAAGNAAQGTFTVTVKAPPVAEPQPSLDDLLAQLKADVLRGRSPQKACNTLNVIENQIRARTGKTITPRQADQYLAAARFVAALLRCR